MKLPMAERRDLRTRRELGEHSPGSPRARITDAAASGSEPTEQTRGQQTWQSVRPVEVERARRLVQDDQYPSRQVLESVAELLAQHLPEAK